MNQMSPNTRWSGPPINKVPLSADKRESVWSVAIANGAPELWVAGSGSEIAGRVAFGPSRDIDAGRCAGEPMASGKRVFGSARIPVRHLVGAKG